MIEEDPITMYYYLVEPNIDVREANKFGFRYSFTAVVRMLGFGLIALYSTIRD